MVYATEKSLKEHGDKLEESDRQAVEQALEQARKALEGDDAAAIETAVSQLQQASHKLSEVVYAEAQKAQTQTEAPPDAGAGAPEQAEETGGRESTQGAVDADFEVVDDDSRDGGSQGKR